MTCEVDLLHMIMGKSFQFHHVIFLWNILNSNRSHLEIQFHNQYIHRHYYKRKSPLPFDKKYKWKGFLKKD